MSARQLDGPYNLQSLLADIRKKIPEILKDETLCGEEKNRSLTASFGISYQRLSEAGKRLFTRFSIFRGGVDIESVDKVCEIENTKETLGELIHKSLIQKKDMLFYMLASLQDYGQRLLSPEEKRYYHQRAANHFASLHLPEREKRRGKNDILPLLEAHYHACQAENYEQAYDVIVDNGLNDDLLIWGESAILFELCKKIPEKPSQLPRKKEGILLNTIGRAYLSLSQFTEAIKYTQQVLDIAREIGGRRGEGVCLGNLGEAYRNLGQFDKAIEYYQQGLDIARETGDRKRQGVWLGSLGEAYRNLGQFDKAIGYYRQGLDIAKEIGDRRAEGYWLNNWGKLYFEQSKYDLALSYFLQAQKIRQEIEDPKIKETEENIEKLKALLGEAKFNELCKRSGISSRESYW